MDTKVFTCYSFVYYKMSFGFNVANLKFKVSAKNKSNQKITKIYKNKARN